MLRPVLASLSFSIATADQRPLSLYPVTSSTPNATNFLAAGHRADLVGVSPISITLGIAISSNGRLVHSRLPATARQNVQSGPFRGPVFFSARAPHAANAPPRLTSYLRPHWPDAWWKK